MFVTRVYSYYDNYYKTDMETKLIDFSLVILANHHNPTILNPDFLNINQIVSDKLQWKVIGQPITTPAFSVVEYSSKVTISVEPMKLQVTDISGSDIAKNEICEIVSNYVRVLPHVQYTALGINFTMISIVDNPTSYLIERFLKSGEWNGDNNHMKSVGFNFTYPLADGNVVFSIEEGFQNITKQPLIISRANFHRDLSSQDTTKKILELLGSIQNDWERFLKLHASIIEN